MNRTSTWTESVFFSKSAVLFLIFAVLTTSLFTIGLSLSKYVLNTTHYSVSVNSSDTFNITDIEAISGLAQVGQTLTAGALTPTGATATYKWQRCITANGTYTDIAGATGDTYTLGEDDYNNYIKVVATGTGSFTGTVTSGCTALVAAAPTIPITAIGAISGTAQLGQTLTAGALTPSGATASYQWQRCSTATGTYTNITGATSSTYMPVGDDYNKYLKVVATGTGGYSGTVISAYKGPVVSGPITAIGSIDGTVQVGQTLTAGALAPAGASATYQWKRCSTANGSYTNITGATSSTYTIASGDATYYIKVTATGSSGYTGSVTSAYVGAVPTPITAIGTISGTAQVGRTLTAGTITPSGATVSYQWMRCSTSGGTYSEIPGATGSTYVLASDDYTYYIKVSATGTGNYSGTVTSAYKGAVTSRALSSIGTISGTATVGQTLTAGALSPTGATVNYQWKKCTTSNGTYTNITGATGSTYTLTGSDYNYYIKVSATGTGGYTGTVTSSAKGRVAAATISGTVSISGTAKVGQVLTADTSSVLPDGAVVTYQWTRCSTPGGTYSNITGATSSTYTPTSGYAGYYIKVVITGTTSSGYTGTLTSAYNGPVAP